MCSRSAPPPTPRALPSPPPPPALPAVGSVDDGEADHNGRTDDNGQTAERPGLDHDGRTDHDRCTDDNGRTDHDRCTHDNGRTDHDHDRRARPDDADDSAVLRPDRQRDLRHHGLGRANRASPGAGRARTVLQAASCRVPRAPARPPESSRHARRRSSRPPPCRHQWLRRRCGRSTGHCCACHRLRASA